MRDGLEAVAEEIRADDIREVTHFRTTLPRNPARRAIARRILRTVPWLRGER
ncbi:MAG: hypothetical protein JXP34_20725 [Planctomycetes bacterium]|nr:hypothetical protein [Planctomycetota bacterium]